ncbi:glycosyltransferase [Pseudoalteromonas denitrificans]|uniref:UDP-N-acetylglucosamine transferase subunit ALG13 n=1 Tax=Pseudoalteromonas denitrificans DSM 6059 TaxID=1123010 RepID=A0A1I1FD50_9GAMM|nr:glycosyltransferase [Pseudoalteromonas denitrificans]SFB95638.1 UDP-N-acetylglucosamine transferase subunit ALG13 [Pseudoalteromonas denitrificans DSM 6059]
MILVTVGTQIPFDRLITLVDEWVSESGTKQEVIAQVGSSVYSSKNITIFQSVEPEQFETYINDCDFIISHAGMGSILTALRVKKPIVIFPRKAALGEHRNDHQLATARSFANVDGVYAVHDKEELFALLSKSSTLGGGVLKDSDDYKMLLSNVKNILVS